MPIWFTQGGAVLWVLGGLSVISLAAIIFVGVAQAKSRLRADAPQGPDAPSFLGRLADAFARTRQGGASVESAAASAVSAASLELNRLRNGMRVLELIAAAAPLLGLLGTVLGMVEAFQQLEQAGSQVDPSLLSGGIWKALLTTAAGLIVALPALTAWHMFDRRLETARVDGAAFITELATKASA